MTHRVWLAELENTGNWLVWGAFELLAGNSWGISVGICVGSPCVVCFQLDHLKAPESYTLFPPQGFPPHLCVGGAQCCLLLGIHPQSTLSNLIYSTFLSRVTSTPTPPFPPSITTSGSEPSGVPLLWTPWCFILFFPVTSSFLITVFYCIHISYHPNTEQKNGGIQITEFEGRQSQPGILLLMLISGKILYFSKL